MLRDSSLLSRGLEVLNALTKQKVFLEFNK